MRDNKKGFTLLELMIVIAIVTITVTLAFPSYQGYLARERVRRATRDLQLALNKTRIHAIKNGVKTTITFTTKGWSIADANGTTVDQNAIENDDVQLNLDNVPGNRIPFNPSGILNDTIDDDYRQTVLDAKTTDTDDELWLWPITIPIANTELAMTIGVSTAGASRIIN